MMTDHLFSIGPFQRRVLELLNQEALLEPRWIYLSFANDEGFRGAIIIKARGVTEAITLMNFRGINPHGEVIGVDIPEGYDLPPAQFLERILTKEELESIFPDMKTLAELEAEEREKNN